MPNPLPSDLHVDTLLTEMSQGWFPDDGRFVALRMFPLLPVAKQTNKYATWNRGDILRDQAEVRAPGNNSVTIGMRLSTASYYCPVFGVNAVVTPEDLANEDEPLDVDESKAKLVTLSIKLRRERDFAAKYFATSIWNTDQTGVAAAPSTNQFLQWNEPGSDPIGDVERVKMGVDQTAFPANRFLIGREVWAILKQHPQILERIIYGGNSSQPANISRQAVAALFELEELLIGTMPYNTAVEGQSESLAWVFGKHGLLVHAASAPARNTPSAGYNFHWSGLLGSSAEGIRIKREDRPNSGGSYQIEAESAIAPTVTSPELGRFFSGLVG